ncbi:hypothetical protein TRP8649_01147 [Pelagimonas phthalicica]|uniref:Stress response protein n=1 Tax=Pelagimonas phthalicica TaxID=1037362 RepID=A0A238J9J4_9RHOB|nr:hypothetical protein [Pelagimonas phthalicica]TDS94428.1 hypothetical protein CLV87_0926 [Pelagimonas phthalicica]SMX27045.1 hypothetical protein TRP8649_01147 [Pelagimonas phthalicica]
MADEKLPEYLKQGEAARLFPVLATTSKEGRTTSIVLGCMTKVEEFGAHLLQSVGQRVGKRSRLEAYTEIVLSSGRGDSQDRPDGLIELRVGSRTWRALIEAKIGSTALEAEQIERYRLLAKENGIDCVISISNQFTTSPSSHPLESVRKSRSKIPVFHWSWMHILTIVDLLVSGEDVEDADQLVLLNELRRFLTHESAGVKGFERMPREWTELNKFVSGGGQLPSQSDLVLTVLDAWHQETRDLSLILTRMTGTRVLEKLPRKHKDNPGQRQKDELSLLRERLCLSCCLSIPDAAAPMDVRVDLMRRCVEAGMVLKAPEDRKSTKARLNWLMRQLKGQANENDFVRLKWPGTSEPSLFALTDIMENVEIACQDKPHLAPHGFEVFTSEKLGAKFAQQANFVAELERIVPEFYNRLGVQLVAWQRRPPSIKDERSKPEDVSPQGLAVDAEEFEG